MARIQPAQGLVNGIAQRRTEISLCSWAGTRNLRSRGPGGYEMPPGRWGCRGERSLPASDETAKRFHGAERGQYPAKHHSQRDATGERNVPLPRSCCSTTHILLPRTGTKGLSRPCWPKAPTSKFNQIIARGHYFLQSKKTAPI